MVTENTSLTNKNFNVLVAGGAGYIGSHACKALSENGFVPVTVDNLSTGWEEAVKYGPFEQVDIRDGEKLRKVFEKYSPIAVMHFAAKSLVGESTLKPEVYWENNFLGSMNLIESAVANKCLNFVFSSTCAVYGEHDGVVLHENTDQRPSNAYGASKRAVEDLLMNFGQAKNFNYVIFRYFNVAGADPEGEIGEYHRPETHLIPVILDTLDDPKKQVSIYGTDYSTPDGTCIRDYVHVCDLVDAHIRGLNWLLAGNKSNVFNLGTGVGFSVREIIKNVELITGSPVNFCEAPRRLGDCSVLVSGSDLAHRELRWKPQRSTLNRMISDAWKWQKCGAYSK